MLRTIAFLAFILLVGHLSASDWTPPSKEASDEIRQAIKDSPHVYVHEGLPHHRAKPEILAKELKRKAIVEIASSYFYTPSVVATNHKLLRQILSSADSIVVYDEENLIKFCVFHADFAVEWSDADGNQYHALICLSCHDILYIDGENKYLYGLAKDSADALKNALRPYTKKRPGMALHNEKHRQRPSRTGK